MKDSDLKVNKVYGYRGYSIHENVLEGKRFYRLRSGKDFLNMPSFQTSKEAEAWIDRSRETSIYNDYTIKNKQRASVLRGNKNSNKRTAGRARIKLKPGQRFGKLTVQRFKGVINRRSVYETLCDCGNEYDAVASQLIRTKRRTLSCGCLRGRKMDGFNNSSISESPLDHDRDGKSWDKQIIWGWPEFDLKRLNILQSVKWGV